MMPLPVKLWLTTLVNVVLSLSTTRDSRGTRRIVSWTTNKVNRDTLLPIGLDGNAITLAGVRAPRGMRAWRYNP